jgi:predicted PurR-regulated permease PerM
MDLRRHFNITSIALTRWFVAQACDALAVGFMWLVGLWALHVPLPLLWAILGGLLQFILSTGRVLALIEPAVAAVLDSSCSRSSRIRPPAELV